MKRYSVLITCLASMLYCVSLRRSMATIVLSSKVQILTMFDEQSFSKLIMMSTVLFRYSMDSSLSVIVSRMNFYFIFTCFNFLLLQQQGLQSTKALRGFKGDVRRFGSQARANEKCEHIIMVNQTLPAPVCVHHFQFATLYTRVSLHYFH